jgi:hypothetical protein
MLQPRKTRKKIGGQTLGGVVREYLQTLNKVHGKRFHGAGGVEEFSGVPAMMEAELRATTGT